MADVEVTGFEPLGKGKYRVAFSDGMTCVLYRAEARVYQLKEHAALSEGQYGRLVEETLTKRAKKRAMHLLEQADRTEHGLREKLAAGEYPAVCIDAAVEYVKSFRYLDDYRYACNYVQYRKGRMSRGQLTRKLMQKGVARDLAERAIREYGGGDEREQIEAILAKKQYDASSCDRREFVKIYQFLLRRGFQSSDILACMKQDIQEVGDCLF